MGVVDTPSGFPALTILLKLWWLQSNPKSPDFKHKVTRKVLWVDGWSNPPWVKVMLKSVTQGKLQFHGCTEFMHKSQGKICRLSGPRATASRGM